MPTKTAKKSATKSPVKSPAKTKTATAKPAAKSGKLTTAAKDKLADKTFAFQEKRKEPLENATHVRNALARFNRVKDVTDDERKKAFTNIKKAAKKFGVEMTEKSWKDLTGK